MAESLANALYKDISAIPRVRLVDGSDFSFSGSIAWGIWPQDNKSWSSLLDGTYKLLMDTWKGGGNKIVRYKKGHSS
jgi:hypothetical protein